MIPRHALLLALAASLSACGPTDDRIAEFAKQGTAFADLVPPAMDATLTGNATSLGNLLADTHDVLDPDERAETLKDTREILKERRVLLARISASAGLLGSYFRTLGQFAASDPGAETETALSGVVEALAKLNIEFEQAGTISATTGFIVGEIKSAKLRAALATHGPVVYRNISDIEQALTLLQTEAEAEQLELRNRAAVSEVVRPYRSPGPLPADWPDRFVSLVTAEATPVATTEAGLAARQLREAYLALGQDQLSIEMIEGLAARLARLAAAVKS